VCSNATEIISNKSVPLKVVLFFPCSCYGISYLLWITWLGMELLCLVLVCMWVVAKWRKASIIYSLVDLSLEHLVFGSTIGWHFIS
jgi:hypothetical protein